MISFAGYAGAALWGSLLVLTVVRAGSRRAHIVAALLGALVIFSGVFWVRDVISWLIIAVIAAMCLVAYRYGASKPVALFMQFLGTYVILDAIKSPLYMIDGRSLGDGAVLSNLTLVPEIGWVGVWEAFAILCVWMLWRALAGSNEQSSTNY